YRMVNINDTDKQIEGLELVFIELPKFKPTGRAEKKLYDLWLRFLTAIRGDSDEVPPELLEEGVTKEAVRYLERNSYTKGQLEAYDKYWDIIRTERTRYLDALEKGEAKGKAEGLKEGEKERKQLAAALARERLEKEKKEAALTREREEKETLEQRIAELENRLKQK
ncbi:MAG: PD-(D/E)XK nuclease family transposase, partial [Prevotellaceae bacterium]|nr:PD-(D/E)XK nuclease family transposase [Prevotellaceae bacterium]